MGVSAPPLRSIIKGGRRRDGGEGGRQTKPSISIIDSCHGWSDEKLFSPLPISADLCGRAGPLLCFPGQWQVSVCVERDGWARSNQVKRVHNPPGRLSPESGISIRFEFVLTRLHSIRLQVCVWPESRGRKRQSSLHSKWHFDLFLPFSLPFL